MKLVLDTNIYIAAFLSKGLASDILDLNGQENLEIYTSDEILEEARTRMINKLKLDKGYVENFVKDLSLTLKKVVPAKKISAIKVDPSDNIIIECAVEARANLIVTMDKHLLKLKSYQGIGIIHPKTLTWIIPKFFEN